MLGLAGSKLKDALGEVCSDTDAADIVMSQCYIYTELTYQGSSEVIMSCVGCCNDG